jgi:hypothetical protein
MPNGKQWEAKQPFKLAYSACALSKVKLGYWEGGNGKK